MFTNMSFHGIVSVVATKRSSANGHTWRYIILTDVDGSEVKISLFPAAEDKPEQISIVDEERQP
jgi:hypothetical protein